MTGTVVTDATVLVNLGSVGELHVLDDGDAAVLVPEPVYEEVVVRGREEGYADAVGIAEAIEASLSRRSLSTPAESVAADLRESPGLGRGEAAAIALARDESARCLTDDHAARRTAESLGVPVGGTIYVLLDAVDDRRLSFESYVDLLEDLDDAGFHMSASLYREAVEAGEQLREDWVRPGTDWFFNGGRVRGG